MITKLIAQYNAVRIAYKHFINWHHLIAYTLLRKEGSFRARAGGSIFYDARELLKKLVRMENAWKKYGVNLPLVKFQNRSFVISDYFGRDLAIPIHFKAIEVGPPPLYLKLYPFDVKGEVVLDIGSYIGNIPLMWIYKGAKTVIAVEPLPSHFHYLLKNTKGLPITCLNAFLGSRLEEGIIKYLVLNENSVDTNLNNIPIVSLLELVERYKPSVIRLDCEGCEHLVLEELLQAPKFGVKKIAIDFHDIKGYDSYESINRLEKRLGKAIRTGEKISKSISGNTIKIIYLHWLL